MLNNDMNITKARKIKFLQEHIENTKDFLKLEEKYLEINKELEDEEEILRNKKNIEIFNEELEITKAILKDIEEIYSVEEINYFECLEEKK